MPTTEETHARLAGIPNLTISACTPLARYTRFGIGGSADLFAETCSPESFAAAIHAARDSGTPVMVIGGGTNLIVSDQGFRGLVLRYHADRLTVEGSRVTADSGAVLQDLVDFANGHGLKGLETLAGIPGWVGAAVYGNAGAYGHSINERVRSVRFFDGATTREIGNAECEFRYRESVFKQRKDWFIFSTELAMDRAASEELRKTSDEIFKIRLVKYPADMKCAGSIFKNLLLADLPHDVQRQVPPQVIREGKVPSAYFLEQVGAKGIQNGGIRVADYHANLIYNQGCGTAASYARLSPT